jgi:hypothetical protein
MPRSSIVQNESTPGNRGSMKANTIDERDKTIYWHRELPPLIAELMGEHTLEATSERVAGTLAHRDELWERCYLDLMTQTRIRLDREIARLGGHFAHVLDEFVDSRRDEATGETWLRGRFRYVLYRRPDVGSALQSGRFEQSHQ